jgi:PilZ domain
MWEDYNYCWVVLCKNNWFHNRQNLFSKHRIPLAETDVYMPPPDLKSSFTARCDECHKEYLYKPSEVLRHDQELPTSFLPHPLFQMEFMPRAVELTEQKAVEAGAGADRRRSKRLPLDVVLVVRGQSAGRKSFQETTFTTSVSAHGALIVLSTKVELGQTIYLKNPKTQKEMECRVTRFGPLYGKQVQVGVDFAQPTLTFWPAVFAPKSWKPVGTQPRAVA